ncbi:type II toxin-antitoxin system YafQ family toxin [Blautia sp. MSJ-19]|uniref:type II toxin-antitoxin system YafQ family toxin n=1 Tax=Blautia sp. MSJ-19 TaxID=2841517 RepID=UPI001C0EBB24|nr:type II toxin-antitoxin system YafQ family toxin [Blautia sp. MSJ-19]MBU5480240.1 type II toxin-antitoxin system YafQ family toxin [Blautia sp. MSJ-19]
MTKYEIKHTTQFKKDYKLAKRRGLNLSLLKDIISKLANGEALDARYRDHALSGNWSGHRECHIQPDWLLIYRIEDGILVLTLSRTGTHSDLFDM